MPQPLQHHLIREGTAISSSELPMRLFVASDVERSPASSLPETSRSRRSPSCLCRGRHCVSDDGVLVEVWAADSTSPAAGSFPLVVCPSSLFPHHNTLMFPLVAPPSQSRESLDPSYACLPARVDASRGKGAARRAFSR